MSIVCPDKTSTVTYKGLSLTGTTSVACTDGIVTVTGMDLMALARAVAPLVAAKQQQRPAQELQP